MSPVKGQRMKSEVDWRFESLILLALSLLWIANLVAAVFSPPEIDYVNWMLFTLLLFLIPMAQIPLGFCSAPRESSGDLQSLWG
jgi:hypothetical protein